MLVSRVDKDILRRGIDAYAAAAVDADAGFVIATTPTNYKSTQRAGRTTSLIYRTRQNAPQWQAHNYTVWKFKF